MAREDNPFIPLGAYSSAEAARARRVPAVTTLAGIAARTRMTSPVSATGDDGGCGRES